MTTDARCCAFGCEARGRDHQPKKIKEKNPTTQGTVKGKGADYPSQLPEGVLWQTWKVSPGDTLGISPPEL